MSRVADDDSRPGSATSLLRTIVGLYMRELGGWMPVANLVALMHELGVAAPAARTAVARVKQKGLLVADRGAGYRLADDAVPMLEAGDRRIFTPRRMREGDPWCLVSFSIPESRRALRHQLRRRLQFIGCGTVSQGLWVCPGYLAGEVEQILDELEVREYCSVFTATEVRASGTISQWWDLEAIATLHDTFAASIDEGDDPFRAWVRGVDAWRPIPYLDPGLPRELLPLDWAGYRSEQLFAQLRSRFETAALRHARRVVTP